MQINKLSIPDSEILISHIRSPGPGGQNVNKVATGILLQFNILTSTSLPEEIRTRLLTLFKNKLTSTGFLQIKATQHRTQERNKQDALQRLKYYLLQGLYPPKKRQKTKPTKSCTFQPPLSTT